jgi:hypothetical protein
MSGDVVERLTDETQGVKREPVGISGMIGISADIESKRVLKLHFNHEVTDQDRANIVAAHNAAIACETAERLLAEARAALRESLTALEAAEDRDERARFRVNSPRQDQEVRHLRTSAIRRARTLTNGGENGR